MPTQLVKSPSSVLTEAPKGSWWYVPMQGMQDEPRTTKVACVLVKCPTCGEAFRLRDADVMGPREDGTQGHAISWDGMVSPSVSCPQEHCGFHDIVRLKDWDEPIESTGVDAAVQPPPPPAADDKPQVAKITMPVPAMAKVAGEPEKPKQKPTTWWCQTCHFEVVRPVAPFVKPGAVNGSNCPNCPKGVMVHLPATEAPKA